MITSDAKRRAKDDDNKGSGSEHFAERGEEIMETGESKEMNKKNIHDEKNEDSCSRPNDMITEKLDYVLASLAELKISVNDLGSGASQQPSHSELQNKSRPTPTCNDPNLVPNSAARSEGELSALRVLHVVQNCKSLDRLCDLAGLLVGDDNELLLCDVSNSCEPSNASLCSRPGSFHYEFSLGTDFTAANQPTQFVNLKRSVSRHITQRKSHLNIVAEKEEDNE